MKLIWLDDCGDSYSAVADSWTAAGNGVLTNARARSGSYSLGFSGTTQVRKQVPVADEHATMEAGFATYRTGAPLTVMYFSSDSGATIHIVVLVGTNSIEVRRGAIGGTLLGSYTGTVAQSVWNHIDVKATLSDAAGAVQVWLNNASVINLTGVDTKNAGTKTVLDSLAFLINTGSGGSNWVDDVYLLNGATGTPDLTSPLGDRRCVPLYANADGANHTWSGVGTVVGVTANTYQNVDETNANVTDYNEAATGVDTYGFTNLSSVVDTTADVAGVMLRHFSQKTDVGVKYERPVVRIGSTNYVATGVGLATSWTSNAQLYARGPDAANWTVSRVDAAEFGQEAADTP